MQLTKNWPMFQHHRGESSLQLFILCFVYLISVPNSFLSFNFQNLDLIKFARSFTPCLRHSLFFCFVHALVLLFNLNFRRLQLNVQQTAHIFSDTQDFNCILKSSILEKKLESILPLLALYSVATVAVLILSLPLCS